MSDTSRRFAFINLIAFALIVPRALFAQEAPDANAIENSKYQATGSINANSVFVRSGPGDSDYPVMKLDKGTTLTVVGKRFDWLKIIPPEGSFCYVAKAFVDRHADGKIGRVTRELYVRVGSQLNDMKSMVATKLEAGKDVTIMGEQNEYFKIVPPEGVYLFVNVQYVDLMKVLTPNAPKPMDSNLAQNQPVQQPAVPDEAQPKSDLPQVDPNPPVALNTTDNGTPTTGPSTQPSEGSADAETQFDKLEVAYADASQKPLDQQDIPALLKGYQKMARPDAGLPESLRRAAEGKAEFLAARMKDREEFLAVQKQQEEVKTRQMALKAEQTELEQRIKATDMKYFAAVGVLRPSSLQMGATTLYRLTDPANGRTVAYLRTDDQKLAAMLGQFIGVKGDIADDAQLSLKVISPTAFESVDQTKLNSTVASQIIPPSLMPGSSASTTSGNDN